MYLGFSSDELDQNQITDYLTRVVQPQALAPISGVQRADILGEPHLRDARLAEARQDGGARHLRRPRCATRSREQLPLGARPDQGLDGLGEPRRQHRPADGRGVPAARGQGEGRRRRPARRDRRRRARAPRTTTQDVRFNGQTATFMGIWVLPDGQLARRDRAGARGDAGDPGAAAGGHEGRHPLRLDRLHPGRDRRGAEDPDRDAAHRHRRHLPVPRLVPRRCSSRSWRSRSRSSAPCS